MMKSEGFDKKRLVLPFVGFVAIATLIALIIYPMVSAAPKDLPLAILSLDEGAETPQGTMNVGDKMLNEITSVANDDSPIMWTQVEDQDALEEAMNSNEFYAAIVIPGNFTASSIAAQMGSGEQEPLKVEINQGKNPAIAETIENLLGKMLAANDVPVKISYLNPIVEGMGSGNLAGQMSYLLTMIITIACSILVFKATETDKTATRMQRLVMCSIRIVYAAILAFCIGCFVTFFLRNFANLAIPFWDTALFICLASFCLMMLFIAFFSWHIVLGIIVLIVVVVCGLTTALLPFELLPSFWQDWLHPWIPERFVSGGLHQILYLGAGVWNSSSMILAGIGLGGISVMLLSLLPSPRESGDGMKSA